MQKFTRAIERIVVIPSPIGDIKETEWVICLGYDGMTARRKGTALENAKYLSWKGIIGLLLVYSK